MVVIENKVILITGGAGGFGIAFTHALLQNGARGVAIVDICDEEAGLKCLRNIEATFGNNRAIFIKTDVTSKTAFEEAFETTIQKYKQLDIVINNAGIANEVQWEKTLAINLTAAIQGSYLALEQYLPKYKSGEEGLIVNIASILGFDSDDLFPMYCTAKTGLVCFGRSIGGKATYDKHKVRVLTLCPGVSNTPLVTLASKEKFKFPLEQVRDKLLSLNAHVQSPEIVAEALIKIIKEGTNGSVWITEDSNPPYEIIIPKKNELQRL